MPGISARYGANHASMLLDSSNSAKSHADTTCWRFGNYSATTGLRRRAQPHRPTPPPKPCFGCAAGPTPTARLLRPSHASAASPGSAPPPDSSAQAMLRLRRRARGSSMRRFRVLAGFFATILLAALVGCSPKPSSSASPTSSPSSGKLVVFAAASLKPAFTKISERFTSDHPGSSVDFDFAGSSELATQLTQGATVD